jgi:hypothetical protein
VELTCYRPPNMVTAVNLPEGVFWRIVASVANLAVATQETVTLLGVAPSAAILCRMPCQFSHADSVILIPGMVLVELVANGFDETPTAVLKRSDGHSVHAYRIDAQAAL